MKCIRRKVSGLYNVKLPIVDSCVDISKVKEVKRLEFDL